MTMVPPSGVHADLSHLKYPSNVFGFAIDLSQPARDQLEECPTGCHLVLIPADMPRKPGMTVMTSCQEAPRSLWEILSRGHGGSDCEPCALLVPALCEHYKKSGLDHRKNVGVTTLDVVRTNKFTSNLTNSSMRDAQIPVIGGQAGVTILPLFSRCHVGQLVPEDQVNLDNRVQDGGT